MIPRTHPFLIGALIMIFVTTGIVGLVETKKLIEAGQGTTPVWVLRAWCAFTFGIIVGHVTTFLVATVIFLHASLDVLDGWIVSDE